MTEQMKNTKKLARGLKDISPFIFSPSGNVEERFTANGRDSALDHLAPTHPPIKHAALFPEVFCLTMLPFSAYTQLLNSQVFVSEMVSLFSEVNALFVAPTSMVTGGINTTIRQLSMPSFQIHDILHPEPIPSGERAPMFDPGKRAGLFIEPKSLFQFHTNLFQLLDHVILSVSPQASDTMVAAYQMLSACLHRNPTLRFSLLIDGFASDETTEMIYERFAKITSQFLGCDIDFLGWIDPSTIQINRELLIEQGEGQLIRKPMKIQLFQLLASESFLETA